MQLPLTAPIHIGEHFAVPGEELRWRFDTSGGPGGQHANRSSTRVELSWDLAATTALSNRTRQRLLERLGKRAPSGIVTVMAADTRSQWRNRALARRRLQDLLIEAMRSDAERVATRIPTSVRRRRLEQKHRRSETKRMRRSPADEE